MKIAIVGPIESAMYDKSVGGTEMWTYNFAEQLVKNGHEVTLFGAAGSCFSGKFVQICSHEDIVDPCTQGLNRLRFAIFSVQEMVELMKRINEFDLVHVSYYSLHYFLPFSTWIDKPIVETIHGSPLTYDDMKIVLKKYQKPYFVFPSENSFKRWPAPSRYRIIPHGININQFPFDPKVQKKDYYFWMGRLVEQKGVDDAIRLAEEENLNLIIAGPKNELAYFDETVKPHLSERIKYVGELNFAEKVRYFAEAKAFLMPIKWEEPFGLVMVEAMACGTPVVAYARGSVPEIVINNETGFTCPPDNYQAFKASVKKIEQMPAADYQKLCQNCRERDEEKYSFERMVQAYEDLYKQALKEP